MAMITTTAVISAPDMVKGRRGSKSIPIQKHGRAGPAPPAFGSFHAVEIVNRARQVPGSAMVGAQAASQLAARTVLSCVLGAGPASDVGGKVTPRCRAMPAQAERSHVAQPRCVRNIGCLMAPAVSASACLGSPASKALVAGCYSRVASKKNGGRYRGSRTIFSPFIVQKDPAGSRRPRK
jgi:hypothetical protein